MVSSDTRSNGVVSQGGDTADSPTLELPLPVAGKQHNAKDMTFQVYSCRWTDSVRKLLIAIALYLDLDSKGLIAKTKSPVLLQFGYELLVPCHFRREPALFRCNVR